jgi:hypothetical protein
VAALPAESGVGAVLQAALGTLEQETFTFRH